MARKTSNRTRTGKDASKASPIDEADIAAEGQTAPEPDVPGADRLAANTGAEAPPIRPDPGLVADPEPPVADPAAEPCALNTEGPPRVLARGPSVVRWGLRHYGRTR